MKRRNFIWIAVALMLLLSGCSGAEAIQKAGEEVWEYTKGQVMVVAATERNRYQSLCTRRLWTASADDEGHTFEELLKEQIRQFLWELAVVNKMAEEYQIELTAQEREQMNSLTDIYYQGLTEADRAYIGASRDDIFKLYCQYHLADKTVKLLTEGKEPEVSDAEAKVIQIQRIRMDSAENAAKVLEAAQDEKTDFGRLASRNSSDSRTLYQLEWKKDMNPLESAAFELEDGEISGILEYQGSWYIQKCVNAYDHEATAKRKARLIQERRTNAFLEICRPFTQTRTIVLEEGILDAVDFEDGEGCTADQFFQLYQSGRYQ